MTKSSHFFGSLAYLFKMFSAALSGIPEEVMALKKSDFLSFFFLPHNVSASSSSSDPPQEPMQLGHTQEPIHNNPDHF
ncbi:MAG: hypothetical protein RIC06_25440 [Cyclobacteriaceae bacterium]